MTERNHQLFTVGLSACLAGFKVRYDGADKRSSLCLNELSDVFNFVTFCPEVAAGFGTPRAPMQLEGNPQQPVLRYRAGGREDLTSKLQVSIEGELASFAHLDGFILVRNSPSCGVHRVKVFQQDDAELLYGQGLFAAALRQRYPLLPIEEEQSLYDQQVRQRFIKQVELYGQQRAE